jgi:UDP-galactopyranose mutase
MPETFDHVFYTGPLDRYFVFRLGRLGTYRYLDMDATIHEALLACEQIESILASNGAQALPVFFTPRP